MSAELHETASVRWYRRLVRLCPQEFRTRYEDEIVDSFAGLLKAERNRRGWPAAFMLWGRGMADAASTATREARSPARSLGGWQGDLWLAIRAIARYPLFAGVVIGTLALSIGGVAAVFMLADPMLFRPLPYADPDRILIAS